MLTITKWAHSAIDTLVAQTEQSFPDVVYKTKAGSRAREAGELVRDRKVRFWGWMPSGRDRWLVYSDSNGIEYDVNFSDGYCSCRDSGAPHVDHDGVRFKLCKHLLAVRYTMKLRDQILDQLKAVMNAASESGHESIVLFPRVWFVYNERRHGSIQENELDDLRVGEIRVHLKEAINFSLEDLSEVLLATRWHVARRSGGTHSGGKETWFLEPGLLSGQELENADELTGVWRLHFQSQEAAERKGQEARMEQLFKNR